MAEQTTQAPIAPSTTTTPADNSASVASAPAAPVTSAPVSSGDSAGNTQPASSSPDAPPQASSPDQAPAKEQSPDVKAPATLLGAEPPKTELVKDTAADKPAETKAETPKTEPAKDAKAVEADKAPDSQKKEEAAQSAEPAQSPSYEPWKLPEGIQADEKGLGEFTSLLAEIELAKGDHTKMQEYGQKLVDRHISEIQNTLKRQTEFFINAFEKQKSDWKAAFEKDPELGGNRVDTTLRAANEFIVTHGGTPEQQKEFRDLMESTGVGNHPAMIRMLAKANIAMREGSPVPATKPEAARPVSKVERRYGKMT